MTIPDLLVELFSVADVPISEVEEDIWCQSVSYIEKVDVEKPEKGFQRRIPYLTESGEVEFKFQFYATEEDIYNEYYQERRKVFKERLVKAFKVELERLINSFEPVTVKASKLNDHYSSLSQFSNKLSTLKGDIEYYQNVTKQVLNIVKNIISELDNQRRNSLAISKLPSVNFVELIVPTDKPVDKIKEPKATSGSSSHLLPKDDAQWYGIRFATFKAKLRILVERNYLKSPDFDVFSNILFNGMQHDSTINLYYKKTGFRRLIEVFYLFYEVERESSSCTLTKQDLATTIHSIFTSQAQMNNGIYKPEEKDVKSIMSNLRRIKKKSVRKDIVT
jgi:hypothetical protein